MQIHCISDINLLLLVIVYTVYVSIVMTFPLGVAVVCCLNEDVLLHF